MSTYYSYFFRAPLKVGEPDSPDAIRAIAAAAAVRFDIESEPLNTVSSRPHFGRATIYAGRDFEFLGMDVSDRVLQIGVFAENLERADFEGDEAITKLERLLGFLSEVTEGEVGEVQGSFATEYDDADHHGHPILRCADGRLRVLRTEALHDYDWYHGEGDPRERYEGPLVTVSSHIPTHLAERYASVTHMTDIHEDLVASLRQRTAARM